MGRPGRAGAGGGRTGRRFRADPGGRAMGSAVGHHVVSSKGHGSTILRRSRGRAETGPRLRRAAHRIPRRGIGLPGRRLAGEGTQPTHAVGAHRRRGQRRRTGRALRRGCVESVAPRRWRLRLPPLTTGRSRHRRGRTPLPGGASGAGRVRGRGVGVAAGSRGARPARRRAQRGRPAPVGDPARRRPRARPSRRGGHPRHRCGHARRACRRAGSTGAGQRASTQRRRARAHRLGVAVAGARDGAQGRPDHVQRGLPDGRSP